MDWNVSSQAGHVPSAQQRRLSGKGWGLVSIRQSAEHADTVWYLVSEYQSVWSGQQYTLKASSRSPDPRCQ